MAEARDEKNKASINQGEGEPGADKSASAPVLDVQPPQDNVAVSIVPPPSSSFVQPPAYSPAFNPLASSVPSVPYIPPMGQSNPLVNSNCQNPIVNGNANYNPFNKELNEKKENIVPHSWHANHMHSDETSMLYSRIAMLQNGLLFCLLFLFVF